MFASIERDFTLKDKLEELLKKPPFNCGFGMYLFLRRDDVRDVYPNGDKTMNDILKNLRAFDVYRLTEHLSQYHMNRIQEEVKKVVTKLKPSHESFINKFKSHYDKRP